MEFLDLAKQRYSQRRYSDKKVEQEKIDMILQAGQVAPTAHNNQPQKIYVLKSEDALEKIRSITKMTFKAPLVLLVCYDKDLVWKNELHNNKDSGIMDVSIITTHMMLQATELGLGSCWALYFNPEEVRKLFNIEDNISIECLLSVGYAREDARPAPLHEDNKDLSETVVEL